MPTRKYNIQFLIQDQAAQAAIKRSIAGLGDIEKAATRAGAALDKVWQRTATGAGQAANTVAAAARKQVQATEQIGVGLHKLQVTGLKFQDSLVKGAERKAAQIAAIEDRYIKRDYDQQVKRASQAVQQQQKRASQLQAIEDRYTKRDYDQRVKREAQAIAQQEKEAKRLADAKKREAAQLEAIQDRYTKRDYDQRVKREARAATQQQKEADKLARQQQKEADQLQAIQDRATKRDYDARVRHEARAVKQKEREAKQLAAIEDRYLREEYRRRVAFQAHQEQEAEAAAERKQQTIQRSVGVLTAAAFTGVKVLGDAYRKIRDDAERAAEATLTLRKNLRVESVLKGEPQTTNKSLLESLQFRMQTGLGESEASDFTRQFIGSVPIARQKKNITPAVEAGLMLAAGKMAARQGGDAGTRGDLAGILGQFHKIDSVQQGVGMLEGIRLALTEGRGDDTPLTQQLLKTAGSIVKEGGSVRSLTEMAALVGVTSLSGGPQEAGTRAEQVNRFFRAGLVKHGKGRGIDTSLSDYLKKIGVTEKSTLEEGMDRLHADLEKVRASGRDPEVYLGEQGVGEYEVRRAVVETEGNYDAFKVRMRAARQANANMGADVEKANQAFLQSPEGRIAVAEAAGKAAVVTRGLRNERMQTYLAEAEASPEWQAREKSIMSSIGDRFAGYLAGNFSDPVAEGRALSLRVTAQKIQRRRALGVGVSEAEIAGATSRALSVGLGDAGAEQFNQIDQLILQRGGTTAVNIVPTMQALTAAIQENNRIAKGRQAPAPAPLPAAPRAGALRP